MWAIEEFRKLRKSGKRALIKKAVTIQVARLPAL